MYSNLTSCSTGEDGVGAVDLKRMRKTKRSVGVDTDLSMADIEHMQTEIMELREEVIRMEVELNQWREGASSREVLEKGGTSSLSFKLDPDTVLLQIYENVSASSHTPSKLEEEPVLPVVCKTEPDPEDHDPGLSVLGGLSTLLKEEPPPAEERLFVVEGGAQLMTPLMTCSVRLVDCRNMLEMDRDIKEVEERCSGSACTEDNEDEKNVALSVPDESRQMSAWLLCNKMPHCCTECGKNFGTLSALKIHQTTHTGEKPYVCLTCGKGFSHASSYCRHRKSHSGEKPFCCTECGQQFRRASALKDHQRIHSGEKPFCCTECGKHFKQQSHLIVHQKTHTVVKPYVCFTCGRGFSNSSSLYMHLHLHIVEKPYPCTKCGKRYKYQSTLKLHMAQCVNVLETSGNVPDKLRQKSSQSQEEPYNGIRNSSSCTPQQSSTEESRQYCCLTCSKSFAIKSKLLQHSKLHRSRKPHCCKGGKKFGTLSALKIHQTSDTGERPYVCLTCGKGFSHKSSYCRHRKAHSEEKRYRCTECAEQFRRASALKDHRRIHTGEKPVSCAVCGKQFEQLSHLNAHHRTHIGVRPYVCFTCGTGFSHLSWLYRHQHVHSAEKPYPCVKAL